jgi:adenosine deaminase
MIDVRLPKCRILAPMPGAAMPSMKMGMPICRCAGLACAVLVLTAVGCLRATAGPVPPATNAEQATAAYLASIHDQPLLLLAFMRELPKGADLHNHLSGAIYAEDYLDWAAQDGRCIDRRTDAVVAPPCDAARGLSPAADAFHDDVFYRQVIDAWSMRDFVASNGDSGHDHFFDTFLKFHLAAKDHRGDMLALAMQQAAQQHALYLELMDTLADAEGRVLARRIGWNGDIARTRARLLPDMPGVVAAARTELDQAQQQMRGNLHCATPQADPGCGVQVRFLYQVLRGLPPEVVFVQMLTGFELAAHDPRVVGINMVMPEDSYTSMHDFRLQMAMLDYLHGKYPAVGISLHAGELSPSMVPPGGLRFHIRASIEQGHALRIGHGVDIMHEDHPFALLHEMAQRHVLVEICLTSNRTILGIAGDTHPLPLYLDAHVPVALATDDAGVSRTTLSREFVAAEQTYRLGYATLKTLVRDSLDHAFLPGASLWVAPEVFRPTTACAAAVPGAEHPSHGCAGFLAHSEKARLEWQQEAAFTVFEAAIAGR